ATKTPPASGNCGTPPPGGPTTLQHLTGSYKNANAACATVNATFNSATGIRDSAGAVVPAVRLAQGGQIFNLGTSAIKVYAIRGGDLTYCDWTVSNCTLAASY